MSHDALDAAGPFSAAIAEMFWVFVGVSLAVYLIVIGFLVFVLRRRAHSDASSPDGERRAVRAIAAAVAVTSVVLLGLGLSDFFTARVLTADPQTRCECASRPINGGGRSNTWTSSHRGTYARPTSCIFRSAGRCSSR